MAHTIRHTKCPPVARWPDQLEGEHDNVRTVLGWTRAPGDPDNGLRLVVSAYRFWTARGYLSAGRTWLEAMLALQTGQARESQLVRSQALLGRLTSAGSSLASVATQALTAQSVKCRRLPA